MRGHFPLCRLDAQRAGEDAAFDTFDHPMRILVTEFREPLNKSLKPAVWWDRNKYQEHTVSYAGSPRARVGVSGVSTPSLVI